MLVFGYNLLITLIQMKREEPVIEENNPFRDVVVRQIKRRLKRIVCAFSVIIIYQTSAFILCAINSSREMISANRYII